MKTVITDLSQLDPNGIYTYADYLTWKFEQTVELIKGRIAAMAAPSRRHQDMLHYIDGIFFNYFRKTKCRVYPAPFDVRLFDSVKSKKQGKNIYTVVQPDLCVICDLSKLDDKGCLGAPDMVIEILSPGNSNKEMRTKKQLYEENAIKEYWIVDPEHENVFQYSLMPSGEYGPVIIHVSNDTLTSSLFPDLQIDLTELFQSSLLEF